MARQIPLAVIVVATATATTTTMPLPETTTTAAGPTTATIVRVSVLSDRDGLSSTGVPTSTLLVGAIGLLVAGALLGFHVRRAR
jgi:hypothetical protein